MKEDGVSSPKGLASRCLDGMGLEPTQATARRQQLGFERVSSCLYQFPAVGMV